ncbi:cytochrome P450 [Actinomadura atramentaria]|uniref:cytochrome P450 n=1 Tax=Actinomadura atramentaria TaxID=1990 RepID=UPI000360A55A|nr:cytochrome P450 [Actinomadura atramentaria]
MNDVDQVAGDGYLARYDAASARDPLAAAALLAGWLHGDRQALFAELRAARPIAVTPAFALVTRYADVVEVLSRDRVFTVAGYAPRLDAALGAPVMLSRDATPMNWREKGLMQVVLDPADTGRVRELAGGLADAALDAAAGRIDAVGALFRPVALGVCAEYFGFPGPDPATTARWSRTIMTDVTANLPGDPEVHAASVRAGAEMTDYLRGLVAGRREALAGSARPAGDVLGRLLRTELPPDLAWEQERVVVNVAALLLGFLENAVGSLTHLVRRLLDDPEIRAAAVAAAHDPDRFEPYVWEALRLDPFVPVIVRTCERDHVLAAGTPRATLIPAGTPVLAAVGSAMSDPDAVADPGAFRVDRPPHVYLHFGYGPHACVGAHPGAAVIAETARRLLRRPGVGLLPPPEGDVVRDRDVFPDRFALRLGGSAR